MASETVSTVALRRPRVPNSLAPSRLKPSCDGAGGVPPEGAGSLNDIGAS